MTGGGWDMPGENVPSEREWSPPAWVPPPMPPMPRQPDRYFERSRAMVTKETLETLFTYHTPSEDQIPKYERLRSKAKELAEAILEETPTCADQQAALRHVREAVMTANAAIATGGAC